MALPATPNGIIGDEASNRLAGADWRTDVIAYHSGSAPPDISVNSSNEPNVLFCPPDVVDLAVRQPSGWISETVFGPTGVGGVCGVLAHDSLDNPYVAFNKLAHKTEGGWSYFPVPWPPYDIAVPPNGSVHVAYFKRTAPDEVTVQEAYLLGDNWTAEDVDIFSAPSSLGSSWLSLALGPDFRPHLLYYADALGEIRYAYKDNGTWNTETVDTIGNILAVGRHGSLGLDSGGVPHIVYVVRTQPTRLETFYAIRGPQGWSIGSMANGFFPTIGIISDDTPFVSYLAGYPDYELRLAHLTGGYWDFETIPDPTTGPAIAQFPTMALDRCDNPHVVWYDFDVPGVLYATKGEPCPPEPEEKPSITLDIDPDTLNLKSKGRWITAYLSAENASVYDIDISSVLLQDALAPERWDYQDDILMLKFNRQEFKDTVQVGESVQVKIAGKWEDGTEFEANDGIRVIDPGRG